MITSMSMGTKRNWNSAVWIGFLLVLAGLFSFPLFILFPVTRDFPWANLLLFATGGLLLITGLVRAFGKPKIYRGKIFGSIFAVLSLCSFALFAYGSFYAARQIPSSNGAPRVGQKAPDFTLPDKDDKPVALADLVSGSNAVVLIFYRGFW